MTKLKKKRKKHKGLIIQAHHPDKKNRPEWTENITKGEHAILSRIQWFCRKRISKGFLSCLYDICVTNMDRAIDLKKEEK